MKVMNKERLLESLANYGYTLLRPVSAKEPEALLENLLKQDDARLLEGFPVVFANMLREKESLQWESPQWHPAGNLSRKSERRLGPLLALSCLLFKLFGMDKAYGSRTMKLLSQCAHGKQVLAGLEEPFMKSESVKFGELELSTERLKNNFQNYVVHAPESEEAQKKKHVLELELLLSELFTPRQKELLRKKLGGKPLTKTEREYYYRVVKKRLRAVASEELHQLARRLVG